MKESAYQQAARHRTAAVADSRLIRMAPNPQGDGFGDRDQDTA